MSNLDDLYALERDEPPRDPPYFCFDPIVLSDDMQAWPLAPNGPCLWWLRSTVDPAIAAAVAAHQITVTTDDHHEAVRHWMAIRRELYQCA